MTHINQEKKDKYPLAASRLLISFLIFQISTFRSAFEFSKSYPVEAIILMSLYDDNDTLYDNDVWDGKNKRSLRIIMNETMLKISHVFPFRMNFTQESGWMDDAFPFLLGCDTI